MRGEAEERLRIQTRCDALAAELDLSWWQITHRFNTKPPEEDHRQAARTVADWEYRQATITWVMSLTVVETDEDLDALIVHELVHIMTACVWCEQPDPKPGSQLVKLNEMAVENVTRAILAARQHGI